MCLCENKASGGDVGGRPCLPDGGPAAPQRPNGSALSQSYKGTDLIRACQRTSGGGVAREGGVSGYMHFFMCQQKQKKEMSPNFPSF